MDLRCQILEDAKAELTHRLVSHPFVERCRNGSITLFDLKRFLVQQGHYGSYFTRYLCALMGNLHDNKTVRELAENLFEELGLDPQNPSTPHHLIYQDMLKRFGLSLEGSRPTHATQGLIDAMLSRCRHPNPAHGLGALCLGAEALVPTLYSDILKGFQACGIPDEDVEFFRIHVECDDGHADTIRDIMLNIAERDEPQLGIMLAAGNALVAARLEFFSGLSGAPRHAEQREPSLA